MNKITLNSERMQEKNNISFSFGSLPSILLNKKKQFSLVSDSSLSEDVIDHCRSLVFAIGYTPKRMKVIEVILPYLTHYRFGYLKMRHIANEAGVSVTTVETVMRLLENEGVIVQQRRYWKHREITSSFHLSDIYRNKDVLVNLSYWFPCLKKFRNIAVLSVCFLLSMTVAQSKQACKEEYESFEARILLKEYIYKKMGEADQWVPPLPYDGDENGVGNASKIPLEEWSMMVDGAKKEKSMFATSVEKIRSVDLTEKGKAEISCFSEKALEYTDAVIWKQLSLGKKYSTDQVWKYFCKVAHTYSRDNDLPINYSLSSQLCMQGKFSLEQPNVKGVASPIQIPQKVRRESEKQVQVGPTTDQMVSNVRDKVCTHGDKERIEKKIKFYRGAMKAAQTSVDKLSQRSAEFFKRMLEEWTIKFQELEATISSQEPIQSDISGEKNIMSKDLFVFGSDDAPIVEYEPDEEEVWI